MNNETNPEGNKQAKPESAAIIELIEAFRCSKVLFTSVSLGVFDFLRAEADVSATASSLGTNESATKRLLDGCVSLGLLNRTERGYKNTPAADLYLRRSSPDTLAGYILYSDKILYDLWSDLEGAIREGTNRWPRPQAGEKSLFENFFENETRKRDFLAGMNGFGKLSSPLVAAAFDLSRFSRAADLGGASGHLVIALCERYPHLRGTVFDLPNVKAVAEEYVGASAVADRIEVVAGDFFKDQLPEADLYTLGRILHDWSDNACTELLQRVYDALPASGALLIAEKLIDEDRNGPVSAHMQSLNMLVCTEGKERPLSEYESMLKGVGFAKVAGQKTGAPVDAILAYKSEFTSTR